MKNSEINQKLKLVAQLMELHGENPFKIRSYQTGRETVSNLPYELSTIDKSEIDKIDGVGKSLATNLKQLLDTGSFDRFDELLSLTPEGVIEMIKIPGFGPKKVSTLWKEAGAETLEDVKALCDQGKAAELKGFGAKTQESLGQAVKFLMSCRGKEKYATVEENIDSAVSLLKGLPSVLNVETTGEIRRKMEILNEIRILIGTDDFEITRNEINQLEEFTESEKGSGPFVWMGNISNCSLKVILQFAYPDQFYLSLIEKTGTPSHLSELKKLPKWMEVKEKAGFASEKEVFDTLGLQFVHPEMREGRGEVVKASTSSIPELLEMNDLKGILHNHSTYSDGKHTLRQMAEHCKSLGYEYLGISDHSQTAVYANGLQEYRVKEQQEEITNLNQELAPFKIFSGIESDILANGSLDYPDEVLSSFDFIVSSIHSGLSMDKDKATKRLLKAIYNPYTTILGHMTGRLILEREGYPVDHQAVIDACADAGVVIEINASPYRLDIDWRWVEYALEKKVMLSINPDAHKMEGYQDMKYGVWAGRKGGLTVDMTLNAMTCEEISSFFDSRKKK